MGSIRKGILGGFAGKVGTVVGISWKGGSYMRSGWVVLSLRTQRSCNYFACNHLFCDETEKEIALFRIFST